MKPQVVISVCLWEAGVEVEMVGQGLFHHLTFEKTCAHFFAQMSQCLKELKANITDTLTPTGYLWENEGKCNVTLQEFAYRSLTAI